jgi:hypothetical protein
LAATGNIQDLQAYFVGLGIFLASRPVIRGISWQLVQTSEQLHWRDFHSVYYKIRILKKTITWGVKDGSREKMINKKNQEEGTYRHTL